MRNTIAFTLTLVMTLVSQSPSYAGLGWVDDAIRGLVRYGDDVVRVAGDDVVRATVGRASNWGQVFKTSNNFVRQAFTVGGAGAIGYSLALNCSTNQLYLIDQQKRVTLINANPHKNRLKQFC